MDQHFDSLLAVKHCRGQSRLLVISVLFRQFASVCRQPICNRCAIQSNVARPVRAARADGQGAALRSA